MKRISLLAFLFLLHQQANACSCIMRDDPLSVLVTHYSFIAHVKVKEVPVYNGFAYTEVTNDLAKIEIIELFKGNAVDSIHISGLGSSCDMGMAPGQEWVIFAYGNEGNYSTGSCTGSYMTTTTWMADMPYFLKTEYELKKLFHHPLPSLKNGKQTTYFKDGGIKSSYHIVNHRPDGEFYYVSDGKNIFLYNFQNGVLEGESYYFSPRDHWIYISKFKGGELIEYSQYAYDQSLNYDPKQSAASFITEIIRSKKTLELQKTVQADKSILSKRWHNDNLYIISHKDSLGNVRYDIKYHGNGNIAGSTVTDPNTGIRTYVGYYENGTIERKLRWYPDKREIFIYYKEDGSLKQEVIRENGKMISSKDY